MERKYKLLSVGLGFYTDLFVRHVRQPYYFL